jgi:hypothetical protein
MDRHASLAMTDICALAMTDISVLAMTDALSLRAKRGSPNRWIATLRSR